MEFLVRAAHLAASVTIMVDSYCDSRPEMGSIARQMLSGKCDKICFYFPNLPITLAEAETITSVSISSRLKSIRTHFFQTLHHMEKPVLFEASTEIGPFYARIGEYKITTAHGDVVINHLKNDTNPNWMMSSSKLLLKSAYPFEQF